jgi:hypothetical protein
MNNFINFNDVNPDLISSWKNKRILSFDIDWAIDEVIEDVLGIVTEANIKCTFFVTHQTVMIEKMRKYPNIELGIHPNFNPLIDNQPGAKTAQETIQDLLKIVPEAKVLRSHSMTHSARWLQLYKQVGITHLSQYYMGEVETIQPFKHVNGLIETPVYFADDGYIYVKDHQEWENKNIEALLCPSEYIKVYNFHPIHISLNTDSFLFYNKTREFHSDFDKLQIIENKKNGIKIILKRLVNENY